MIKLSDMRCRIEFQKATVDVDEYGNRTNTYTTYCERWARVNMKSGSESFLSAETRENVSLGFVVRFDSLTKLITPGEYRISFRGKLYNIISIDNFMFRNESLTIYAEEERDD